MRNDRMQEGSTAVALAMVTPGYDQDPASGVADYASHQDQAQFEADKRAVYKHPLFPLLALLFERCEQATQSSDNSNSESFNMDIQAFVQHQERDRKPFLINDPEIDGLMIKAIQVLRIHLLELEKVQELCKDFCNRYITCLKGKMQSENLLRSDYSHHGAGGGHDGMAPSSGSNGSSPLQVLSSTGNDVESGANGLRVSGRPEVPSENGSSGSRHQLLGDLQQLQQQQHQQQCNRPSSARSSSSSGGGSAASLQPHNKRKRTYSDDPEDRPSPPSVHGSTPLSQIGAHAPVNDMYLGQDITVAGSPSSMQSEDDEEACGVAAAAGVGSLSGRKTKPKRGVLPKQATNIMRAWLFQHLVHPYPTEDEKRQIANDTNLTLLQVNNWFINARRRILQPMLDGAGSTDPLIQSQPPSLNSQQPQPQIRTTGSSSGSVSGSSKQRSKPRGAGKQQQADWQSEDSGSESNGSSDAEGAYSGLGGGDLETKVEEDDDEDSEDGGIDIEETKPFAH
ncbi:homeobox protein PKNOX1 isoform X5 [Nasonia vitripennis]|uniref:Homeobox domain-containing protein n=1 Tax=Nasonia vitripennis TaxID=7425 RepID=A0A7M7R0D0_NASVI|nr:homeobox protein PKNOX1 isoform X5 [Nasonia vitripennis]XP_032456381.1 homeobox protein PKNOX1 isoform X5 [Nasonia vitripennis]